METDSKPAPGWQCWAARHPLVTIGALLLLCLGPFVNKAVHIDDPLFIWSAEWIQQHPGDFYGSDVNWYGVLMPMAQVNQNPPGTAYFLAGVASLLGWGEMALHSGFLLVAFAASTGIYCLARMWCGRPLLATIVALITPAFLVSSTTLMCDVPMLALWAWSMVLWERALKGESAFRFLAAGGLAGLALLTKYNALVFLPLLLVLALLRKRRLGWWLTGLAVPLAILAAYQFVTAKLYGRALFSLAADYAAANRMIFEGGWESKGISGLAFAGGCLLPVLFFGPLLWPRRHAVIGGLLLFIFSLGVLSVFEKLGPITLEGEDGIRWGFLLQSAVLMTAGLHLLLLTGVELWQRRDTVALVLAIWVFGGFTFATILNWTVSARSLLPIVPAAAILLVRRLERGNSTAHGPALWPLLPSAAVSLAVAAADFQFASSARTAARQIVRQYQPAAGRLWFQGHWGFQYYMEKLGTQPVDFEQSDLQPGDVMVVPLNSSNLELTRPEGAEILTTLEFPVCSWLSTFHRAVGAGFFSADCGPLPFAIGRVPPEEYCVVKLTRPTNYRFSRAMLRQVKPDADKDPAAAELQAACEAALQSNPNDAQAHVQLALLLAIQRKPEAAILHYREALRVIPDFPLVLNNLAWILAADPRPEVRDGPEAVRLASRAVELTGRQQPLLLGTLAAAYAETGQFTNAIATAVAARDLAKTAGQRDIAGVNDRLLKLYRAGKTAHDAVKP